MSWSKSRRIQFLAGSMVLFILLFMALRAIFYFGFSEVGRSVHPDLHTLWKTLFIGFKFDLQQIDPALIYFKSIAGTDTIS